MTRQESFKGRVRARMEATGEKYGAARRVLIEKAQRNGWVSDPDTSDERVAEATGRGWDQWCTIIDAELGRGTSHSTIAAYLVEHHGVDRWWAQTVTVGYERIKGLRLKYQMADGTFTAGRSRTVAIDSELLRKMLLAERDDLFPGFDTQLRSKPESRNIRIVIGPGTAEISLASARDGRTKVTVAHAKLPTSIEVAAWGEYWSDWLAALDE